MVMLLVVSLLSVNHGDFQKVLDAHLKDGNVAYAKIKETKALDPYVDALAKATVPGGKEAKMAFWINAYNALTIDMIADEWPVKSIRDLDGGKVWDTRKFAVAGKQLTLNEIEHGILRKMGDPRIHAAVNCASKGCPPLYPKVFTAAGLDGQLDQASRAWMKSNGVELDKDGKKVKLNKIFDWYGDDFVPQSKHDIPGVDDKKQEAALNHAAQHVHAKDAEFIKAGGYAVEWKDYDWGVNAR